MNRGQLQGEADFDIIKQRFIAAIITKLNVEREREKKEKDS